MISMSHCFIEVKEHLDVDTLFRGIRGNHTITGDRLNRLLKHLDSVGLSLDDLLTTLEDVHNGPKDYKF